MRAGLLLLALGAAPRATQAQWFQVANRNNSASPDAPSTIYLGDTGLTFGCNSWATLGGQWGGIQIYIHTGTDVHNGTAGGAIQYYSTDARQNTSGTFTSTGTWYWGVRMQYNTSGTIVGWYCRNRSFWSDAWGTPTSDLSLTVSALNAPSGQSAARNTTNPHSAIDLAWTRGTSGTAKNTLVVRSTASTFTAPTQGSAYATGATIGSGTVISTGAGTSHADTGLSSGTTYYYAFYAINNSYYSAAVTANATTRPTDATWDGGGADENWQTDANWAGDLYPHPTGITILRFAGATRLTPTNNYAVGSAFSNILFNSGASSFTLTGNSVNVHGKIENSDDSLQTVSMNDIAFNTSAAELDPTIGDLRLNGSGSVSNNGNTINVWGNTGKILWLNMPITNSGALRNRQNNIIAIEKTQGYSGNTELDAGEMWICTNGGINSASAIYLGNGTMTSSNVWFYLNDIDGGLNFPRALNINPGSGGNRYVGAKNTSGQNEYSGNITASTGGDDRGYTLLASNGGTLVFSGVLSGDDTIRKQGGGTVVLTNVNNSFSGMLSVEVGTLQAGVTGALGTVQTTTHGVDVQNGASLALNGALTYPNETIQITGLGVTNGGALRKTGSGTAVYPGQINVVAGSAGGARIESGGGPLTFPSGSIINLSNNTLYVRTPNTITMNSGSIISNATKNTGDGAIYKDGSSVFSLRPSINMTGTITVAEGTLEIAPNSSGSGLVAGNLLILSNGVTIRSDGTAARTVNKETRIDGDVTLNGTGGNGGAVTYAGNVNLTGGTRTLTATNAAISGVISNGALIKTGAGPLTLSGASANVYTGVTVVIGGQLTLNKTAGINAIAGDIILGDSSGEDLILLQANNQIADTSVVTMSNNVPNNRGFIRMNGFDETIGGLSGLGLVQNDGLGTRSTLTLDVAAGASYTSGGLIRDNSGTASTITVAKAGAGIQTLTGTNTFTGGMFISAGTLINLGSNTSSDVGIGSSGYYYGNGHSAAISVTGQVSAGTASNTVGTMNATALRLENNGRIQVNFANSGNMNGTAGTDWDVVTVDGGSGTYTVNAVDGSDFVIALKGTPTFSASVGSTNIIVDAATATSFATNKFTIDISEFNGGSLGGGTVTVDADSGNLRLIFAPGTAPDVVVLGNSTAIPDGDTAPSYADDTDFGDVLVDGGTVTKTYTITNSGSSTLGIGNIYTNATGNPFDFIVTAQPGSFSLAPGATTTFQVQFNPTNSGLRTADLEFTNNTSSAKNPYTFRVQGTGTYVEVAVTVSGSAVTDGDTTPTAGEGTDFGSVGTAGATSNITYTITNSGNRAMSIGNVTTSGTHAADFIVTAQPSGTLNPSNTTTFTVQFNPSANGLRTASLSFTTSDDSFEDGLTENPFNFDIQGTGAGTGISNFPTSLNFSSVLGTLPSPAFQAFSVTNVGLGTLTYDITTNASWLTALATSGSAAPGAGNLHTATVALVAGMVAGTSNATITITGTDGFTTNSPKTVAVAWTISAIPDPTAQSATADGAEMVRLAWTTNATYNTVLVVYQSGGAVSTDPTQGTSYSVGNSIGSGVVVYKGTGTNLEHVVAQGTAHHYKFYSINNNYYSPGVTANATTLSYLSGEIVEQFGYTNAVTLNLLNGGQGWTNAWTLDVPNTNTDAVVDRVNFSTFQPSWPTERGNRIVLKTAATTNYQAFRGINTVNCGRLYIAALIRRQFDEGSGHAKYQVLSFMNGSTEVATVGKRGAGDDQFGTRSGSDTDLFGAANSFADSTDYLVIGRYDFDTGQMSGIFYDNATSVPSNEPTYLVSSTDTPAGQITGIRIAAGSGSSGWPGECHFDEIRVARNWGDLLNLLTPKVTNYVVDGDNIVDDGQMTNGTYEVRVDLSSAAGVDTDGTPIATTFDIMAPGGTAVVNNDTFGFFTYTSPTAVTATDINHAVTSANNALGVYTVRVSAVSSNGGQIVDNRFVGNACTGTVMTFTVNDDDTAGPTFGTFVGQAKDISGAVYTNDQFVGGFWVTGTVTDAGSGLYAASNTFTLSRDGSAVSSGVFAVTITDGGGTSGAMVSNNFPQALMLAGAYTLTVFSVDFDIDRSGDALKTTNVFSFSVVDPPAAPGLAVGPLTLTYSAMLGSNADTTSTFSVTNVGIGTLYYTNYQTYGSGASGWFTANPTNNSLLSGASRIHTGWVASASFTATGSYVATNRVAGNQTNSAQEIVVTLTVTNIPSPTAFTATPSGAEHVALRWTESSGRQVLIVHRQTNAPSADPTQGSAYSVGNALGDGTVIYKGAGSYLDHVVAAGSTNFYNVYTINNDRYSLVTTRGTTNGVYYTGEIVEQFAYTNSVVLNGLNGGFGWTNSWNAGSGYGISTAQFSSITGYPADGGNVLTGTTVSAYREFNEFTSGRVYVSYKFRISNGAGYAGLSFFNNGTEQIFFGERGSGVNEFAVDGGGANESVGATLANNTEYTIIGMYDFDNNIARGWLYTNATQSIPTLEPTTGHANITDGDPTRINRVRLESGSGTIVTRWDEVRISKTWDGLLRTTPTYEWDAGAGSDRAWNTVTNWVGNVAPAATNDAWVNGGYTAVVSAAGAVATNLYVGSSSAPNTGGTPTGTIEQTGGTLTLDGDLILGDTLGSRGTYLMTNGTLTASFEDIFVGNIGVGIMTVTGTAQVVMPGGLDDNVLVGFGSAGGAENSGSTLNLGGSAVFSVGYDLRLGFNPGADGTFNMYGGTMGVTNSVLIASGMGSTGRVNVSGGTLTVNTNILLAEASGGLGTMTISGGSISVLDNIRIGEGAGGTGIVTMTAGSLSLEDGNLLVGNAGFGVMSVSGTATVAVHDVGGASVFDGNIVVGDDTGATNSLLVAGNAVINIDDDLVLGDDFAGALGIVQLSGSGAINVGDSVLIGDNSGATGIITVTSGTIGAGASILVGSTGPGSLTVHGGSVTGNIVRLSDTSTAAGSTVLVGGGRLVADGTSDFEIDFSGTATVTGGVLEAHDIDLGIQAGALATLNIGGSGTVRGSNLFNVGFASSTGVVNHTGGTLDLVSANAVFNIGAASGASGFYTITNGTITTDHNMVLGSADGTGTGVFAVVGSGASITIGDGTTEDFTMQSAAAELRATFMGGALSPIQVQDDIVVAGTLTISNDAPLADGTYVIVTSLNSSVVSGTFAATNWLGGTTGTVVYANRAIQIVITSPQEIAVLGTNSAVISSGDLVPSTADGTDYGTVLVTGATLDRTFGITNLGGTTLTISGVTTSGTGAADFSVLSWPTTVASRTVSNLTIRFDPSTYGLITALVTVANNDSDEGTYTFVIQGTGGAPGISNYPTSLNFSSVLGTLPSPAFQAFSVTNVGNMSLNYTITTNASWLTALATSGSAAPGAGNLHTATVALVAGMVAGTSNATITVTDANATNSPQTVAVSWTISAIPDPTAQTATADGKEMVDLAWTKNASYDVMIVYDTSAIATDPSQGTSYNVGDTIGSGRVVYKGAGAALEHVVPAGSAAHYKFYSINNNYYSPGVSANATLGSYRTGEIVDQVAYTNGVNFNTAPSENGGQGWNGAWSVGAGTWTATNGSLDVSSFYPAEAANSIKMANNGNGALGYMTRPLTAMSTGTVYFSYLMRFQFNGADKYTGMELTSNGTAKAFFGEVRSQDKRPGIAANATGTALDYSTTYDLNDYNSATGNVYVLFARYNFATRLMNVKVFYKTTAVPATEPTSWDATYTFSAGAMDSIDGIRLIGGSSDGGATLGEAFFDEIRVATTWANILNLSQPVATNYVVNGGSNVTDAQVTGGTYSVVFDFYDASGMSNSVTMPQFDIWNATGTRILTNQPFASITYSDSGRAQLASNATHAGASGSAVVLGVYTSRWTAINSNGVQVSNSDALSNGTITAFTVVDDDTAAPTIATITSTNSGANRNLHISLGAAVISGASGSSTNMLYTTTDGTLTNVAAANPLIFWMGAGDASLLARNTVGTSTNSHFSIGVAIQTNVANYDSSRSTPSADTTNTRSTNVWTFSSLTAAQIDALVTNTALGLGTNAIVMTWRDADNDRASDQSSLADQQHGFLVVADDDSTAPVVSNNFAVAGRLLQGGTFTNDDFVTGFIVTGNVADAFSGLFAGASNTMAIKYQDGSTVTSGIWTANFASGANGILSNTFLHTHLFTPGIYTMAVTVVDYDIDRPNDSLSTTSNFVFTVVNAPQIPGLAVGPTTLAYDAMLGSSPSTATFTVTNVGLGTLYYTNTQTYGTGASGWFSANPTNATITGGGLSRIHTGWVASATFNAVGTYYATNTINGNQTNSAVEIVVTLNVTNIPNPTSVTATNDGAELMRLTAAEAAGRQVLVVLSPSNAPVTSPANGTAYSVGSAVGSGTVVFKFTGSSSVTNLEHVVAPGSTNFYAFYTINNDRYSTGVVVGVTASVYQAYEIVEQFGYTNGVGLQNRNGGYGWTNAWTLSVPATNVDAIVTNSDFAAFQNYYPAEKGNRFVFKTTNNATYVATRNIPAVTGGKIYFAMMYRRQFAEGPTDDKFSGMRILNGGSEVLYFGERGESGLEDVFGVRSGAHDSQYGALNSFGPGTNFLLIARYDFDTDILSAIPYDTATEIPVAEPAFVVHCTNAITRVDAISIVSGAGSGWNGEVYFDEIRVATNWTELLVRDKLVPYATNYLVNGASDVTDAQVAGGNFGVRVHLRSDVGVEATNTISPFFLPNFDILTAAGAQIVTNKSFTSFAHEDSGRTLMASNATHATAVPDAIVLGVYTVRWSAVASNGNAAVDVTSLSNGTAQSFTVVDDDSTAPDVVTINSTNVGGGSLRLLHISMDGTNLVSNGAASNSIAYSVDDGALTNLSSANPLLFWLGARDASGLNRGNANAETNSHLSIGSAMISNVLNWDVTRSTPFADTSAAKATNVWSWITPITPTELENLVTNTAAQGSNAVVMTWRDADGDRSNDFSSMTFTQGWFVVNDDDTTGPTLQDFNIYGAEGAYTVRVDELVYGLAWSITGRVRDVASGVNVNGSISNQPNNSPYYEIWDNSGTMRLRKAFDGISFSDGGATTLSSLSNGPVTISGASIGTWTARVVAADNDEDFGNNDHAISTSSIPFQVVAGSFIGGLGRGPASLFVTSSYGVVTGASPWPNFYVTNIGAGALSYSNTITYGSVGGWLSVAAPTGVLIGTGASQVHTAAVNTTSLNPGTYTATITINGDQTNAAQTIAVTLDVFGFYAGEIVDQFTNSAGTSLHASTGGTGWTNAWSSTPSSAYVVSNSSLNVPNNYPSAAGNKICATNTTSEIQSYRYFAPFTTGKVFMAIAMTKSDGDANGFNGISFMNNSAEVAFAGKIFNNGNFGIDLGTNGGSAVSSFGVNGPGSPGYFYIGMYDFENDRFYGKPYFNNSATLPLTEPTTWEVTGTPSVAISSINGVRIAGLNEGTLCYDELRVAPSWENLLNLFNTEPTVHAGGMNFRDVTTNSMTVGWSAGNGANRIVVAREGAAVTFSPSDNTGYSFNSDFSLATDLGSGNKVVYNGSGTNFSFTGLGTATQYFFAVYEYNGAGSLANYYTNAGFLTGNRWTLDTQPVQGLADFNAYEQSTTAISNTWHSGSIILVDLGRHDSGTNGNSTVSPDMNGNTWNNIGPVTQGVANGTKVENMVNAVNGATTVDIEMTSGGWNCNGILNGGHTNPSPDLLGALAITNATMDYFFTTGTDTFKLSGLNTNSTYNLTFFGSRATNQTRVTTYTVGANSVTLTTSGSGIGAGGVNYNNNTTAVLRGLSPDSLGEISVSVQATSGGFGYIGILRIEESPQPDGYLILRQANAVPTNRPSDGVTYTNGQFVSTSVVATVVNSGFATTVSHTGLQTCTPYFFTIYPFRQRSGQGETINYVLTGALTSTASTACGEPTIQASNISFSVIGTTNMTVTWQNGNGDNRLVVARGTNAVDVMPTDLSSYTASATYGSGSHLGSGNYVVYRGTGTSVGVIGLSTGVTYHFRVFEFYGTSGSENYLTNTAVLNPNSAATISFELASDSFTRTNTSTGQITDGGRASGGTGWNGNWSQTESVEIMHDANFGQFKCYPRDTNNGQIRMPVSDTQAHRATRSFASRSSGKIYASWLMNMSSGGANTFAGLSFTSNGTEVAFGGKTYANSSNALGITFNSTDYNGQYLFFTGSGNDYLVVLHYDFEDNALKVKAMVSSFIQSYEPDVDDSWDVVLTNVNIGAIDGIRLAKQNTGITYFDEVRVGASWEQVVLCSGVENDGPQPTLVYIGTNYLPGTSGVTTNLSDAELKESSGIDFAVQWNDPDGVFVTNSVASGSSNIVADAGRVLPNWDPLAIGATTNEFGLDRYFYATNVIGNNGSLVVTTYVRNAFNITNINFANQYFVTLSAEDNKSSGCSVSAGVGENVYCGRGLTVNYDLQFYVYDDDTNPPVAGSRPMRVLTNSTAADAQSVGDLERYFIYDGMVTQTGMRVSLNVYDEYSDLQRSASGSAATNLNVTVAGLTTNNYADYAPSLSSASGNVNTSTSVWNFAASMFTYSSVSALWGGDGTDVQGQDNEVLLNSPDADADRVDDSAWSSNRVFGFIRLQDDDATPPVASNIVYGGATLAVRPFWVATNGVRLQGTVSGEDRLDTSTFGSGTNSMWTLTDDEVLNSGDRGVTFAFGGWDLHSGLSRGTSGSTNTVMNFSIGTNWLNDMANYNAAASSSAGPATRSTSVWSFANATFNETKNNEFMQAGRIPVYMTYVDSDNDRTNDTLVAYTSHVGYLQVVDDDIDAYGFTNMTYNGRRANLLMQTFETRQGWSATTGYYSGAWTAEDGTWTLGDITAGSVFGLYRSGIAALLWRTNSYMILPPRTDPGSVIFWARATGTNTSVQLTVDYWPSGSSTWINVGRTNVISGSNYVQTAFPIDYEGNDVTIRVSLVTASNGAGFYMDDLSLTRYLAWTNDSTISLAWMNPTNDPSGVFQYRYTNAPATIPAATNAGVVAATNSASFASTAEGIVTGYVFMVDNDQDRSHDQRMGPQVPYVSRIDLTPPPRVTTLSGTNGPDDQAEIQLDWGAAANAGNRGDGETLSPWYSYAVFYSEDGTGPTTNSLRVTFTNGYETLRTNTTTTMILSNLLPGSDYRLAIAGIDRAGNMSPLSPTVQVQVANFVVTQGLVNVAVTNVEISWTATNQFGQVLKAYDGLFIDSYSGFTNTLTNSWSFLTVVTNSYFTDRGFTNATTPYNMVNTMRFYRVSVRGTWETTNAIRRASQQIYVAKTAQLKPGENWLSLLSIPDTNTIKWVFGTNRLPKATVPSGIDGTKISWYGGGTANGQPITTVYLSMSNRWVYSLGGTGIADDALVPLGEGFNIELPSTASAQPLIMVGELPTNTMTQTISGNNKFNIVSYTLPRRMRIRDLGLKEMGFQGVPNYSVAGIGDELRVLNNSAGAGSFSSPRLRVWLDSDDTNFYTVAASPAAANNLYIEPDESIIIWRKGSGDMVWTNNPFRFYSQPTRNITP